MPSAPDNPYASPGVAAERVRPPLGEYGGMPASVKVSVACLALYSLLFLAVLVSDTRQFGVTSVAALITASVFAGGPLPLLGIWLRTPRSRLLSRLVLLLYASLMTFVLVVVGLGAASPGGGVVASPGFAFLGYSVPPSQVWLWTIVHLTTLAVAALCLWAPLVALGRPTAVRYCGRTRRPSDAPLLPDQLPERRED
ncbi:hypothetical protein Pla123a_18110 [Posidoniimonas polymericola]|uniref:Uncharacterized protein n=1 Tax=Posidoniimonas polymericola TaxID=2528002 RepID=A0A5C5YT82_9BACT|nr:hypothetical protein [Posidoniimonas polymericola]TWT78011.1 hypothetical protein Pla123a_18110 [Posidoniimonas polymericola]